MPGRVPLDDELKTAIRDARLRILENCADLVEEGRHAFGRGRFPRSCFLAMTAIEEAGKIAILRFFTHAEAERLAINQSELDVKGLDKFLRCHPEKAREAA